LVEKRAVDNEIQTIRVRARHVNPIFQHALFPNQHHFDRSALRLQPHVRVISEIGGGCIHSRDFFSCYRQGFDAAKKKGNLGMLGLS